MEEHEAPGDGNPRTTAPRGTFTNAHFSFGLVLSSDMFHIGSASLYLGCTVTDLPFCCKRRDPTPSAPV